MFSGLSTESGLLSLWFNSECLLIRFGFMDIGVFTRYAVLDQLGIVIVVIVRSLKACFGVLSEINLLSVIFEGVLVCREFYVQVGIRMSG